MENQNGRTDAKLEGYRLVDQVGGVALLYPELPGAPAALSDEACAWVSNGKLYVMPGESVGEIPLGPLLALLERAGVTASCPEQPHTGSLANSESVPERTTPEPRPEQIEIDGVLVAGGVTDSEPYIMRDNGIETVAVCQSNGNVYFPCGSFIPSAALVELLRRSGPYAPPVAESRAPAATSGAPPGASLQTRGALLEAMQAAVAAIEKYALGGEIDQAEALRLCDRIDECNAAVLKENPAAGNIPAWTFRVELDDTSGSSSPNNQKPSARTRYTDLVGMLLSLREENGGGLPDKLESAFVGRLDELWWEMSEEEQEQVERDLGWQPLGDGDKSVSVGSDDRE